VKKEAPLPELETLSEKNITLAVRHLNEDNLIALYGEINNPYLVKGFYRLMVFELQTYSEYEVFMHLKMIEFQFAGKSKAPIDRFRLSHFWKIELDQKGGEGPQDQHHGWGSAKVNNRINETMAPNKMRVYPDKQYSGLIAFMGRFPPRYGSVTLFVPVFTETGELIHNFKFDIEIQQ
jgi:hypothetical protein